MFVDENLVALLLLYKNNLLNIQVAIYDDGALDGGQHMTRQHHQKS